MRRWPKVALALWVLAANAQPPAISQNGVMNAATHMPPSLPGGEIALGARFLIRGVRLTANASDVRVLLHHASQLLEIPVIGANSSEIDARMPTTAPLGAATLVVETSAGPSKPFAVSVASSQLGLFSANGRGWGRGKIENLDGRGHPSPNALTNPARAGQMATILATGLGGARRVEILIGGRPQLVASIQHDADPGLERIRFRVPADAPRGCFVPVYVRTQAGRVSNIVTMAIAAPGSDCTQMLPLHSAAASVREGMIALARTTRLSSEDNLPITEDQAFATFLRSDDAALDLSPLSMLPPAGQCNALTGDSHRDLEDLADFPLRSGPWQGRDLDAGAALNLTGRGESRRVPRARGSLGSYWSSLGADYLNLARAPALFLEDTDFTIASAGGNEVDPFSRSWLGPARVEWINQDRFAMIERSKEATFVWGDSPHDALILVALVDVDEFSAAGAVCFCTAREEAGHLTVPADMLAHFPAASHGQSQNVSMLMTLRRRAETTPGIRGLDGLLLVSTFARVRPTDYR